MSDYRFPLGLPLAPREYRTGDLLTIGESSFDPPIAGRYEVLEARRHGSQQILILALQPPDA